MAQYLKELSENLIQIRKYLIKIGPKRRCGNIISIKLEEANDILEQYNSYIDKISKVSHLKEEQELTLINKFCSEIKILYKEIRDLCTESTNLGQSVLEQTINMDKFDLKVALSLLPVMTDKEENTKELIDGIEYYGSTLEQISVKNLITFVMKTRLSQSAKLKLLTNYENISDLLKDMRTHLLPKKAATAIQSQLQRIRQGERPIVDYGKELSELFVDLTISQADGNPEHYNILRPLNEKFAIKRFADGLRNRRLSTIIAARDFKSLKDAIQVAQEEEMSFSSNVPETIGTYQQAREHHRHSRGTNRGQRGQARGRYYTRVRTSYNYNYRPPPAYFRDNQRMFSRANTSRGRYYRRPNVQRNNRYVNTMSPQPDIATQQHEHGPTEPNIESLNHFFRS